MTAAIVALTIEQGATFRRRFILKDKASGVPYDFTGYTARMQIRRAVTSESTLVALSTGSEGGITLGGAAGTIDLEISAADTAGLGAGRGVYDLELVAPSGDVRRLIQGKVLISAEVTR